VRPSWRDAVGAGSHAETAADAVFVVDQDYAIFIMVSRSHRADVDTGSVFALVARGRHEELSPAGELHFKDLNPLLPFGDEVTIDACLGTLGRRADGNAAFAFPEVDDHTPGANCGFLRGLCFWCPKLPVYLQSDGNRKSGHQPGNARGPFNELSSAYTLILVLHNIFPLKIIGNNYLFDRRQPG
jgi:hypothetical protein